MGAYLRKQIRSDRGASFSIALMVFLVCAAVSSVVIAAATASMGQFATLGKADQRYHAVTSAAGLFRDSLGDDGARSVAFEQTRVGTTDERKTREVEWKPATVRLAEPPEGADDALCGYDFLPEVTSYALFGVSAVDDGTTGLEGSDLPEAFASSWWQNKTYGTRHYVEFPYDVAVSGGGDELPYDALKVKVTARLWDDWTLELEFSNADAEGSSADAFSLYMVLVGSASTQTSTSERLESSQVSGADVTNTLEVTELTTSEVTWHLQQVVPGRGLARVED